MTHKMKLVVSWVALVVMLNVYTVVCSLENVIYGRKLDVFIFVFSTINETVNVLSIIIIFSWMIHLALLLRGAEPIEEGETTTDDRYESR